MVSVKRRDRDRGVRKTQNLLHEALFSPIHERDLDSIAVKEILHRADVGRSTYYSHFHDKEELLLSGIRATLGVPVHIVPSQTVCTGHLVQPASLPELNARVRQLGRLSRRG